MVRTTTLRLVPAALCGVGLALTLVAPAGADPDPPKGPPVDVPADPPAGRPADRPGERPTDLPAVPPADPPADVPADQPDQAGGGGDSADRPADPPGNNGTVKIDDVPFDDHPNNEPHVSCSFQVDFYGFDQGDLSATVLFEAVPPTVPDGADRPGGVELLTDELAIGEDAAGGGTDLDASGTYDLTEALAGIVPHPQQGWHVKLTVHAEGSQGADTKHKVFWVSGCDTPPTPTTPTTPTSTPGSSTTTPGGGHTPPSSGPPTSTSPSPSTSAVASNDDDGGGGLPLTGSNTLPLVLGGAALVAVGTAGVVAARKYRLAATSSVE